MIIRDATGETVDLGQPENVRRGMVFAPKDPRDYCLGEGHIFVVGRRDEANGVWRDARDENLGTNVLGADRLLGCDPAHAERADCERFGIAPGIAAGAHGFARTRDGFAVDFRRVRMPTGAIVGGSQGQRSSPAPHPVGPLTETVGRFVGLDARHASSGDIRRLCCGERPATWTSGMSTTMNRMPQRGFGCTLAIGHDGEHEDIASGAKWAAGELPPATFAGLPFPDAFVRAAAPFTDWIHRPGGYVGAAESEPTGRTCPSCGAEERRQKVGAVGTTLLHRDGCGAPQKATVEFGEGFGAASLLPPGALHIHGGGRHWMKLTADGILSCSCGSAKEHADNCDVPAGARADADVGLRVLRDGGTQKEAGAAVMARVERRKREAGLVELANAVPEGLDPVGWRAAVLALDEAPAESDRSQRARAHERAAPGLGAWLAENWAKPCDYPEWSPKRIVHAAYRRAIAPHKAPPPERKQRGPRLTVDDGRDE